MYTRTIFPYSDNVGELWKFPVRHAFSLRKVGNMSDTYENQAGEGAENRRQFLEEAGFGDYKTVRAIPQHSVEIVRVTSSDEGREIECDGLFTTDCKVALTMCVGDCYPIIISMRELCPLMMLHVGVEGAAADILGMAVNLIRDQFVVHPNRLLVGIGPGICARCYDAQWIVEKYGNDASWKKFLPEWSNGTRHCDLRGFIMGRLREMGIRDRNMFIARECTCCSRYPTGDFFLDSHHRAKTKGREGRFLVATTMARPSVSLKRFFGYSPSAVQS